MTWEAPHPTRTGARRWVSRVEAADSGARLDRWLARALPDLSRARIQALIQAGRVRVGGRLLKAAHRLRAGEGVEVEIPPPPPEELAPEPIPLRVVFEDEHVLVVDKPAGMVTHPGAGQSTGTLAAAALAHAPCMAGIGGPRRPGIVHRLDKGTSGLMVLAKTRQAYDSLVAQLGQRRVTRRYLCLVHGVPRGDTGVVDSPIARDSRSRVRMAVAGPGRGRRAVTRFRVLERLGSASLLECSLETGRTHQIRVHMTSLGHPILGDRTYGGRADRLGDPALAELTRGLDGVALHAAGLAFAHPASGQLVEFMSPLPARIDRILCHLRTRRRMP